ncbi:substrate of the Dot/Icm secretion system [Legionella sainthelensi]|uniref:Substrate of the Dot/Icm secretion system n=1 Tax=Legionella sainthelensi TaxID=28087 RepID=A0A0W0YN67_9GAMM|nr:hypothetical protein [Legionella sainthelensi]KTD58228.1 substrate of the Dot/Icm secretion system [Legionella sainthelensi]VEH26876.1 Exonuclease SbcC [Legionella sainthelensi]
MQERAVNIGVGLKKVNEVLNKCVSRAEEFLYLMDHWKVNINDLTDNKKFKVNNKQISAQEIKEELAKVLEKYNTFIKKNLQCEKKETEELIELQQQLTHLYKAMGDVYAYLCINKTEDFLEEIKAYYKKEHRMLDTMQFVFDIADHFSTKNLQCESSLSSQFKEVCEKFEQIQREFVSKIAIPRNESAKKLVLIMNDFIQAYLDQGASNEEIIKKLKPYEKYFTFKITKENEREMLDYTVNSEALCDVNPIEFLNQLFDQFYHESTLFSRSKTALKQALDKRQITYEASKDWYSYVGWDIPKVTDKNMILVTYDKEAYNKFFQESGPREMDFFKILEKFLDKSKDIIIASKQENLQYQKELSELIDKGIKQLEQTKPENKGFFAKKFGSNQHELITGIINQSIELLNALKEDMPIRKEDLVRVILSTENALNAAMSKLKPQKIDIDAEQSIIKQLIKTLKISNTEQCCFYKSEEGSIFSKFMNLELRELIESYQVQKTSEKDLPRESENTNNQIIEPNQEEDKWQDLQKKMNLQRVQKIMSIFVDEYCGYKGYLKGGGTIEELQTKLEAFKDYFQIEIVEKNGLKEPQIIFNTENIKNKNPHELFNELFKKFTEDIGYGTGSRSIEALKIALTKSKITYTAGSYGTVSTLTSALWSKQPPVITDENKRLKLIDNKHLSDKKTIEFGMNRF